MQALYFYVQIFVQTLSPQKYADAKIANVQLNQIVDAEPEMSALAMVIQTVRTIRLHSKEVCSLYLDFYRFSLLIFRGI